MYGLKFFSKKFFVYFCVKLIGIITLIPLELPKSSGLSCSDCLWNVLTVSAGAMDCTEYAMGISKIVNSVIVPLADNGVSLFCMSTYQGDFILVNTATLSIFTSKFFSFHKIKQSTNLNHLQCVI